MSSICSLRGASRNLAVIQIAMLLNQRNDHRPSMKAPKAAAGLVDVANSNARLCIILCS